jgi:hypothetical protein
MISSDFPLQYEEEPLVQLPDRRLHSPGCKILPGMLSTLGDTGEQDKVVNTIAAIFSSMTSTSSSSSSEEVSLLTSPITPIDSSSPGPGADKWRFLRLCALTKAWGTSMQLETDLFLPKPEMDDAAVDACCCCCCAGEAMTPGLVRCCCCCMVSPMSAKRAKSLS